MRIVLSEPANAQLLGSGTPQERTPEERPRPAIRRSSPTRFRAGRRTSFKVLQKAIDAHLFDEVVPVAGAEGMRWARELAAKEGIFTGVSGSSTFAVARQVGRRAEPGSVILAMLPDTGEQYLSAPLFDDIPADMTDDGGHLLSTPGYPPLTKSRFGLDCAAMPDDLAPPRCR